MHFCPERLIQLRKSLNINKAEAARRLNISAMAYGRYEKGEREPSYQSVYYIAQIFRCNIDYLYGLTDDPTADSITIFRSDSPELYSLVEKMQNNNSFKEKILTCAESLNDN